VGNDWIKVNIDVLIKSKHSIVKQYNGKFIVLKDGKIVTALDDLYEAFNWALRMYGLRGRYLIVKVGAGDSRFPFMIYSTPPLD
jgi:hypothetical protein